MIEPRGAGAIPADHDPGGTAEHEMNDAKARPMPRPEDEATMAQLLDPLAWERRLQEARARRAEALASRKGKGTRSTADDAADDQDVAPAAIPSGNAAAAPATRAAITDTMRLRPATGPALADTATGPSIRELAARGEAPPTPAPVPPEADPFALHSLSLRPPARDRISELPSVLRRAAPTSPLAEPPAHAVAAAFEADAGTEPEYAPAFAAGGSAGVAADDIAAEEPALGAAPAPTVPPRSAPRRRAGRSTPRIAAVFAAGLGLGLAGAFALSGPVVERVQAFLPGGDITLSRAAPEPEPGEPAATGTAEAPASGAPTTAAPTTAGTVAPDRPEAESTAAPAEVAALTPAEPAPAPAVSIPDGAGPALLPLPTAIPHPEAPGPAGLAAAPDLPEALASPGLPATPDPEAVAGTAPPGSLGLARPLARPDGLPAIAAEEGMPIDFAALTPEVPAAGAMATEDDAPTETLAVESGAPGAMEEPAAAASTGAPARVLVHVPTALSGPAAEAAIGAIRGAGFDTPQRIDIAFPIGSTNIRYYFSEDRAAAEAMAAAIRAETGQDAVARDFTGFRPQPSEGTVEIFLAGQPGGAPPAQQAQPAPPPPVNAQPAPSVRPTVEVRRLPGPPREAQSSPQDAMRDLERLADEIGRAIARSLRD